MQLVVVPPRSRYLPGKDTPVYGDNLGPHCYGVPFTGIHLRDGTTAGSAKTTLTALWLGERPSSVPSWSSLLTGPLFTGMDVTVRVSRA
jgi:phospholipid/cholesterol/gamma-HCH transport system substrate-binding protein